MVASGEIAATITARARAGELPNLVVDPVMTSSSGRRLGIASAIERLLPYATVITPNQSEASALLGWQVATPTDMAGAASQLAAHGAKCVVVTGGDGVGDEAVDAMWTSNGRAHAAGVRGWIRATPTAPDAPTPRRSRPGWRWAIRWRTRSTLRSGMCARR